MKHLHPKIISLLEERGFSSLTLSQRLGIPKILSGRDTLIIARTGSGKTEASVLPIFSNLLESGGGGIKVLYIAPLKALNRDLLDRLEWWAERLGIKIAVRHGDTSKSERRKQTLNPPDVLITTPETLQALLIGKRMRVNLIPLRFVVIDEIHELVEEKRGIQLSLGLERLVELCGRKFQRIGLSATVGTPKEVAKFLSKSAMVVDATEEKGLEVLVEYPLGKNPELSDFLQVNTETASRIERILKLISEHESVLVFVNTREMAETLSSRFNLITHEIDVHHSSLSKYMRIDTEKRFKAQKLKSIVCTSSMELGIDIGSVDLVIQYASPRKVSRLVQRAGRSGHRIGETSKAYIIAVSEDDILEASVIARRAIENELEETRIYENALDVLVDQLVGLLMDEYRFEIERAFKVVKRAYPYRNLSKEKFLEVLDFLKALRLIWIEEGYFGRKRSAMNYYFENLSMIPDTKHYKIFEVGTNSYIGTLDEEFIATRAEIGENFVVKGRAWTLLDIKEDRVEVSESKVIGAIPAWEGELIPVPFEVAQEVAKMRENFSKSYPISKEAFSALKKYLEEHEKNDPIPSSYEILIEEFKDFVVIHAPFGSLANETLGRLISVLLSSKLGASLQMNSDPMRIALQFPVKASGNEVRKILLETSPKHLKGILEITLKRSNLFVYKLTQVAKRFGAISRESERFLIRRLIYAYEGTPLFEETLNEIFHEKLDVEKAMKVMEKIQKGELKIRILRKEKPSLLALPILERMNASDLIFPRRPEREILKILRRRLENKKIKLFCLNCGEWSANFRVKSVAEYPECRKCGARFLTVLDVNDEEIPRLVKKSLKRKALTKKEQETLFKIKKRATLVLSFGKKAVLTLSGRGIGERVASKILSRLELTEEELLKEILEAERLYARTRRFWD